MPNGTFEDAIQGYTFAGTAESAAIRGTVNDNANGQIYGVVGETRSQGLNSSGVVGKTVVDGSSPPGPTNGVWGINTSAANTATGVFGQTTSTSGATVGVWGRSGSSHTGAIGVYGEVNLPDASGTGVHGRSPAGTGAHGLSTSGTGVQGHSTSGLGVAGTSVSNYGVYGYSQNTNGVVGQSGGNGAALVGFTQNGIGVFGGVTGGGNGVAGYFDGPVFVKSLTVQGGAKSAAVPHPDGTHRRMYCLEAPEAWFEDFGTATLQNGRAEVALDPDFDAVVRGNDYLVFLTEIGDAGGLYVSRKGPHRFEVQSRAGASASGSFDYRVIAKRKDSPGTRLEKVSVPKPVKLNVSPSVRSQPQRPVRRD